MSEPISQIPSSEMRPGMATVIACPHCQTWLRCLAMPTIGRQGADIWSDLQVEHDFWQTPAELVFCPACHTKLHRSLATEVGVLPSSLDELDFRMAESWRLLPRFGKARELAQLERYLSAPSVVKLSAEQVLDVLINDKHISRTDEIDLRLQHWRYQNDTRRHQSNSAWHSLQADFERNVERLLALLAGPDPFSRLVSAEIYRELGDFAQAMQQLPRIQGQFGHEKAALMGWIVEERSELLRFH